MVGDLEGFVKHILLFLFIYLFIYLFAEYTIFIKVWTSPLLLYKNICPFISTLPTSLLKSLYLNYIWAKAHWHLTFYPNGYMTILAFPSYDMKLPIKTLSKFLVW